MITCRTGLIVSLMLAASSSAWPQPLIGPEFQVNTYTSALQLSPSVSVSPSGSFIVAWHSDGQDGSGFGIFTRRFDGDGVPLDPNDVQVNTHTPGHQFTPSVVVGPSGGFVVAWSDQYQDGSGFGIFARRFDNAWNPLDPNDFQVNTYTSNFQFTPAVAVGPSGDFVVAWSSLHLSSSESSVFARRFDSSGSPLDPNELLISTFSGSSLREPTLAIGSSGDFVVAWQSSSQDGSDYGVFARRFDSDGIALDPNDIQVNTHTRNQQLFPTIGIGPSGGFIVAWASNLQDGNGFGIFARRFDSAGNALDPNDFQVNTYTRKAQLDPSIGIGPLGDFIVTWGSDGQDGMLSGIFARRFDSAGVPLDPNDFQVNTYTQYAQASPAVSVGPKGDFVVTWESQTQDGSAYGIFARQGCFDSDGDTMCDQEDVLVYKPLESGTVDCRTPGQASTRPLIRWYRGNYDRFRAVISWDASFAKTQRVSSGKTLIRRSRWMPGAKAWRRVCNNATGQIYIRVLGVDRNVGNRHPRRKTLSNIVSPAVVN